MSRMSTAIPVMMRPVKIPMIGATRSHFWMSREYVAVRSSLTRAVYLRNRGCLKKLESRKLAKIPNAAILSLSAIGAASHFAIAMTSAMCRVGTFTVTSVAKLPQTIACAKSRIEELAAVCRMGVMFNVQIGNLRVIEGFNRLRSIIRRLGTSFLVMPRLEYNAEGNGTAIGSFWIISEQRFHPASPRQL